MAFLIHSIDNANVVPWEYLPAGAIQPKIGMALTQTSGQLAIAATTTKPTYISMAEYGSAVTAGTLIPVIKVRDDIVFETTSSANFTSDNKPGTVVQLHGSSGMQVTATASSGVATIVSFDGAGKANVDKIRVRFL